MFGQNCDFLWIGESVECVEKNCGINPQFCGIFSSMNKFSGEILPDIIQFHFIV